MANTRLDSRYSRAIIRKDSDNVEFVDWFGDLKFDVSAFEDNIQYDVRPEDTVFSIASEIYGQQKYYWVVCRANDIFNPFKKLTAGQKLVLPSDGTFRTRILGEETEV